MDHLLYALGSQAPCCDKMLIKALYNFQGKQEFKTNAIYEGHQNEKSDFTSFEMSISTEKAKVSKTDGDTSKEVECTGWQAAPHCILLWQNLREKYGKIEKMPSTVVELQA